MQCPKCQHENPAEAQFCLLCGTRIGQVCSQCQKVLPTEAHFCMVCGNALIDEPAVDTQDTTPFRVEAIFTQPLIAEAERRQLTVMFCDLVDFTRLASQLDPEDLRMVVRAYQEQAAGVIQQYDGYIAQYLGDGLLVYFGWPHAHEDDAHRAVHTGLGIAQAIDDLNATLKPAYGIQLAVRLGIHTGPVVVGEMGSGGRHENLALGETPNIAARLEGVAHPGTVVISDDTRRLVAGAFDYDDLGPLDLKGVGTPVPGFRVRSVSAAASRFEASMSILTPMVGRDEDVALLIRRWEQAREGEGQVVLLSGPPGIGKSRLLQALCTCLDTVPHSQLRYQCSPYHTHSAFYPIITQVTRTMLLSVETSTTTKLERLKGLLAQLSLPVEEATPLFARMLAIPTEDCDATLTMNPQRQKERTIELVAQGLVNWSRQKPVLVLFEDIHWIDPSSLEMLGQVIEQVQEARVLIVLTYRPDFEPPWSREGHITTHMLSRLSRRQTAVLIEQVSGEKRLPPEVIDQVVSRTDGIPLFVEELTKHVLESEWLTDAGAGYTLTGPLPPLAIPSTLQDSLMARLDRLASVKDVVQQGAAIGREFSYGLLSAVSSLSGPALQAALGQLLEAELISQRGQLPQAIYHFKHALIQDAAYQSLLRSTRHQVHLQIAQALETQFPDTVEQQPELVAYHYTEADLTVLAVAYWRQAAHRAGMRSAVVEAIRHSQQGLALLDRLPDTPERSEQELALQIILGSGLAISKGPGIPEVLEVFERARTLSHRIGDTSQLGSIIRGLWGFHLFRGNLTSAVELAEEVLDLAQCHDDHVHRFTAHSMFGGVLLWLGEFAEMQRHLELALSLYDPNDQRAYIQATGRNQNVHCLTLLPTALWLLGYPEQARQRSQEAVAFAHELSNPQDIAYALSMTAGLHVWRREPRAAQEYTEAVVALSAQQRVPVWEAMSMVISGWALSEQGQDTVGFAQIRRGLEMYQSTGSVLGQAWLLVILAESHAKRNQVTEGLGILKEARERADTIGERLYAAEIQRLKGELWLAQSEQYQGDAETCFHQALDISRSQQAKSWELRAATSLARLWQSQDKRQEAHGLLAPVYEWFTEGFDTTDLKEAKTLLEELRS